MNYGVCRPAHQRLASTRAGAGLPAAYANRRGWRTPSTAHARCVVEPPRSPQQLHGCPRLGPPCGSRPRDEFLSWRTLVTHKHKSKVRACIRMQLRAVPNVCASQQTVELDTATLQLPRPRWTSATSSTSPCPCLSTLPCHSRRERGANSSIDGDDGPPGDCYEGQDPRGCRHGHGHGH